MSTKYFDVPYGAVPMFLIDMFVENGHNKQLLKNLVIKYNNKKNNKNNHKKLSWIPNISPKIKREFKKIGKDIAFTSGKNLQQILCQKKQTQTTTK